MSSVRATAVSRLTDAALTAFIAVVLALPLAGVRTEDGVNGLAIEWRLGSVAIAAALVFMGRLGWRAAAEGNVLALLATALGLGTVLFPSISLFLRTAAIGGGLFIGARFLIERLRRSRGDVVARHVKVYVTRLPSLGSVSCVLILLAVIFPFTPLATRYALDVAIMVLTYVMLAWGLNITVGFAGLLDLGYAGFYAIGAYCYALLAENLHCGFWSCLPVAGLCAAITGLLLGAPVLRLRGDYFAVVTLGFGEIVRLVLLNWTEVTGGPNGVADIPRPSLFGLEFNRPASDATPSFSSFFHLPFDPTQRVIFLYFVILSLSLIVGWFATRLRRLPIGRAWESFREDDIACASLGINRTWIKLAAYSLGACIAGLAGAFFAARQGFVSPESFTFTESATILAIVILGGVGHPLGIVLAAFFVIGLPELFRGFEQYRMLAFGLGMVLIMVWRPGGMMANRVPSIKVGSR